jgi:hypothetical protein
MSPRIHGPSLPDFWQARRRGKWEHDHPRVSGLQFLPGDFMNAVHMLRWRSYTDP